MNNDCNKVFQDNVIIEFELICLKTKKGEYVEKNPKRLRRKLSFN